MQAKVQNISPIKQRILKFAGTLGVSKRDFYKRIDVSRGTLESKTGITEEVVAKFIAAYPQVSVEWLMTGEGFMLRPPVDNKSAVAEPEPPEYVSKNRDNCQIDRPKPELTRPRIPFAAAAGALSVATEAASEGDCDQVPIVATLPAYDFTIIIEGDSMAPEYRSGDELACRMIDDVKDIQWGKPYILDTRDGVVFKSLYYGDGEILCHSINPAGPSFAVADGDVLHVASVVGLIRQLQS